MATENPLRLIGSGGTRNWALSKDAALFTPSSSLTAQELNSLLERQKFQGNQRHVGPSRSGSAPPSMEGSALSILMSEQLSGSAGSMEDLSNAIRSCASEEQLLSHPAYVDYYFAHVNLNPRLPAPRISRENRRLVQHIGGSSNNWKMQSLDDNSKGSVFVNWPVLPPHKEEPEDEKSTLADPVEVEVTNSRFNSSSSLKGQPRSLTDQKQEGFPWTTSRNLSHGVDEERSGSDASSNPLEASTIKSTSLSVPNLAGSGVGDAIALDIANVDSEMINLNISKDGHGVQHGQRSLHNSMQPRGFPNQAQNMQAANVPKLIRHAHNATDQITNGQAKLTPVDMQSVAHSTGIAQPLYTAAAPFGTSYYANVPTSNLYGPQYTLGNYTLSGSGLPSLVYPPQIAVPMPVDNSTISNFSPRGSGVPAITNITPAVDYQSLYKLYGHPGVTMQPSYPDPLYLPYFQHPSMDPYAAGFGQYDTMRVGVTGSLPENHDLPKGSLPLAYMTGHRPQLSGRSSHTQSAGKSGGGGSNYYESPLNVGAFVRHPSSSLGSLAFQGSEPASPVRRNENLRFPFSSSRTPGPYSGWQGQRGREKFDNTKYSFLEELKSSKARRFELSDIAGHIVEYSADQHGSRFIQQKLESCTPEEKASVFQEILPHATSLMTDVFGNYVIQKFFEHGNPEQRKELANQLTGHILTLSLQMYGCRVIQKALEVIDLDQKTKLVFELDGHVLRCVRDQNGNHVIQKCIECVPTERVGFIISAFREQVATLSTHPYGCRVIQRVLEHCTDELQNQGVVDEILESACILAQDQYGNYVTQHVLERGRPHERSQIITKLAGQIVQMSQHKFASNVIEKCLVHGNGAEREILIGEILGQTEGNDNLLIMMKDQFANYVVQRILETCTDKQRETLLNRIRVHLQALKKYTYGKHIVARVEQLCEEETRGPE